MKSQVYACLSGSLAFLKQQVMLDVCPKSSCLVCVETPTLLLPFLNSFAYILVMTNLNTLVFFQFKYHLFSVSIIVIGSFGSAMTFPQNLFISRLTLGGLIDDSADTGQALCLQLTSISSCRKDTDTKRFSQEQEPTDCSEPT